VTLADCVDAPTLILVAWSAKDRVCPTDVTDDAAEVTKKPNDDAFVLAVVVADVNVVRASIVDERAASTAFTDCCDVSSNVVASVALMSVDASVDVLNGNVAVVVGLVVFTFGHELF
jgi:hypothetical protein